MGVRGVRGGGAEGEARPPSASGSNQTRMRAQVALWQGDVTQLRVDAIVNCNNDTLNERSGISGHIFAAAGPPLEEACAKLRGCAYD